ncbi:MAG TPA: NmrA family NAD(P)-binding protein [Xanthobacteraceae bacterium]|nr:NmrA family NAD(P)-binding protein [Xanthobacteraceae bacterium]
MTKPLVLVTGAAGGQQGGTGRRVSEMLLARGVAVRAFVRRIDERAEQLRALGAEVVEGDFLDYQSVERALRGVSTVYFAYPVQAGLLTATAIMADAARKAGVTRLIDMVMLISSPDAPTPRMRENYLSEQIFEWAGIGAAHVRATVFYENVRTLTAATIARDGAILLPWGSESTLVPLVAGEDVARVVACALTSPSVTPGSAYPVIGSVLALRDIVATFERVLGRQVRYREIPDDAWRDGALARGYNEHAVEHLSRLWQSIRSQPRQFDVTDTIETLGGGKPKSFEAFVREQQAVFKPQPAAAQA